ncbi:MAG: response regulator [Desulfobacteraceae bacterium]|jgi:DNA-binding NtrC family response regulator
MQGLKLLIVDYDVVFVDRVVTQLKKEPIVVSWLKNNNNILDRIESLSPDVVILSTNMPNMDVMGMLSEIKGDYPLIEVIMLAEENGIKAAITGMQLGAVDYLRKPVRANELIGKIKNAYQKRSHRQEKINRFKKILV